MEMLTVFGFMVISTYMLERLCRFAQYREFVGWFWKIERCVYIYV